MKPVEKPDQKNSNSPPKKRIKWGRPEVSDKDVQETYRELLGMTGNQRRHARPTTANKSAINW